MKSIILLIILTSFLNCNIKQSKSAAIPADTVFINRAEDPFLYFEPDSLAQYSIINTTDDVVCPPNSKNVMKWIEIVQFQNRYLFFLTNNPGGLNKYIFCHDQFYERINNGDHPTVEKIVSMKKNSPKEYTYVVNYDSGKPERKISIYIIDEKRNIAILKDDRWGYKFVIAQQESYNLPVLRQFNPESAIIVPFDGFDKSDYEKLLKDSGFTVN